MNRPIRGAVHCAGTPLGGVVVSDGRHAAATDVEGRFSLPGDGPFVFVVRPTGFSATPWYLPADGAEPTFTLEPVVQPVPFSFAQVTDLHLSLGDAAFGEGQGDATIWIDPDGTLHERIVTTPSVLDALLGDLAGDPAGLAFAVATGDLSNQGSDAELAAYATCAARSRVPVHSIPGNHDHHGRPIDGYHDALGPRWYSFDHGGVHFVALDWFTHRLGIDAEHQETWLAADLALVDSGTPIVLLTHDLMDAAFYDRLPRRPIATFSGHWHTNRVVEAGGTVHYNTGTATFGGLDYSPAQYRVATWDGAALDVVTRLRPVGAPRATRHPTGAGCWSAALDGAVHLGGPVVAEGLVVLASGHDARPDGRVVALDAETGERRWEVALAAAVKSSPLVVDGAVVAVSVAGEVVCVDLASGAERWRTLLADPTRLWCYLRPASDGRRVFVGDVARFAALDLADGAVAWERTDLGQRENMTSLAHPLVVDGTLLVGFVAQVPDLWGLDPATGDSLWPSVEQARSVYSLDAAGVVLHLPRTIVGGMTADPVGRDVYAVRLGSRLDRIAARSGEVVWSAPFHGWFNPAAPVVAGDLVLGVVGAGGVRAHDRATGGLAWEIDLGGRAPLSFGAYRAGGNAALASLTVCGDVALLPLADGRLVAIDAGRGVVVGEHDVGAPMIAPAAVTGDRVVVAPIDGVVHCLPLGLLSQAG